LLTVGIFVSVGLTAEIHLKRSVYIFTKFRKEIRGRPCYLERTSGQRISTKGRIAILSPRRWRIKSSNPDHI